MKKYVKPELFYEHFELSQQIAACSYDLIPDTFSQAPDCLFKGDTDTMVFGKTIFLQANDYCEVKAQDYCVHNGLDTGFNTFNS